MGNQMFETLIKIPNDRNYPINFVIFLNTQKWEKAKQILISLIYLPIFGILPKKTRTQKSLSANFRIIIFQILQKLHIFICSNEHKSSAFLPKNNPKTPRKRWIKEITYVFGFGSHESRSRSARFPSFNVGLLFDLPLQTEIAIREEQKTKFSKSKWVKTSANLAYFGSRRWLDGGRLVVYSGQRTVEVAQLSDEGRMVFACGIAFGAASDSTAAKGKK